MILETWLPPAVIISVVVAFNSTTTFILSKRIDDLRDQMRSDHANLANHLTRVENKLDAHISNYSIHNKED